MKNLNLTTEPQRKQRKAFRNGLKMFCILSALVIISACGGGGGGGSSTSPSSTITFTADSSSPGSNTVYMTRNSSESSGNTLAVDIKVNNASDVYGAAFDVDFDSSKMTYSTYSNGSFLEQGGASVSYQVATQSGNSGKLVVGISKQGAVSGASGIGTLLTLKFNVSGGTDIDFSNNQLANSSGSSISGITWSGGTVTVQ